MSATLSPPPQAPRTEAQPPSNGGPLELPLARAPLKNPGQGIDYELFLDCVHCGLCTASGPTSVETGNGSDGPRGPVYLMRAVRHERRELNHALRRHLELCLHCRACEAACLAGLHDGPLSGAVGL